MPYSHLIRQASFIIFTFTAISCSEKEKATMAPIAPKQELAEPGVQDAPMGVPVCDAFLGKYKKCLDQLPEDIRQPMETGLEKAEQAWRKNAAASHDHDELVKSCEEITAALEESMTAQGCEW